MIALLLRSTPRQWLDASARSPLARRLTSGAIWSLGGATLSRGLTLLSMMAVATMLGQLRFAELGVVQSTVNMFGSLGGSGFGLMAIKYVAELRTSEPERAGRILALSSVTATLAAAIFAGLLFVLAPWLAAETLAAPHLSGLLRLSSVLLFFTAVTQAQGRALTGFEAFGAAARVEMAAALLSAVLLVAGAKWRGLEGALWALTIGMGVRWVLSVIALSRVTRRAAVRWTLRHASREWRLLYRFSLPALIGGAISAPIAWISNAILVNGANGYAEMGLFHAANQVRTAILFVPLTLGSMFLPVLSNVRADSAKDFGRLLTLTVVVNTLCCGAAAVVVSLASPLILAGYGPGFQAGRPTLIVLAFSTIFVGLSYAFGQAIVSAGRMWVLFGLNMLWGSLVVLLSWLFVGRGYGSVGIAWAHVIAFAAHAVWQGLYVRARCAPVAQAEAA
ncbi:MAG TPA: oligosaccharide flippase family protein [Vicinamibacterales bacterium]